MKRLIAAIAVIALGGCAGFAPVPDYSAMSAAAIKASQERDGIFSYVTVPTPWGPAKAISFDVDKGVITGKYRYTLNPDGSFTLEGEAAPKPVPAPKP